MDDGLRTTWPDYRDSIRLVRNGREDPEPLRVVRESTPGLWGELDLEYRGPGSLVVRERIRSNGPASWTRVITVEGLATGCEAVVRVPHQDRQGRPLGLTAHGEPVPREPGRLETEIPLSRDGPIEIELRRPDHAG